ncbi:hypothetical protein GIB67_013640 [Kingdonia uniflora]|uniref:DUF659 domain-containing protein n=1 Tax=Kingdonia uniflora TaxID=39325 RepID=A0A7J7NQ88_9MAGN|nr:hypothetical protein GIB67_013640 [Kingdonia uniflora]
MQLLQQGHNRCDEVQDITDSFGDASEPDYHPEEGSGGESQLTRTRSTGLLNRLFRRGRGSNEGLASRSSSSSLRAPARHSVDLHSRNPRRETQQTILNMMGGGSSSREYACGKITSMFYENAIPFNVASSQLYHESFNSVANYGITFLKSVDIDDNRLTADYLITLFKNIIDYVGVKNIVQIVTDQGSNFKAVDPLCEWIAGDDDEPLLPTDEEWPEELERELSAKDPEVNEQRRPKMMALNTSKNTFTSISDVPSDILLTHILTRLDGPALASISCASIELHSLSSEGNLWSEICNTTWPFTKDSRVSEVISAYPNGPSSFFSNSFSFLLPNSSTLTPKLQYFNYKSPLPSKLISAVDIYYRNNIITSKVQETETLSGWFRYSPFRIDVIGPKEAILTQIPPTEFTCCDLSQDFCLSWILIDPLGQRAANISSWKSVSVHQHWLLGEIQLKFATILPVDQKPKDFVQCEITVAIEKSEGKVYIREMSFQVEDMDCMNLDGKESLEILDNAMESERRATVRRKGASEKFDEYLRMKRERKEIKLKKEGRLDSFCKGFGISILLLFGFWLWSVSSGTTSSQDMNK